MLPIGSLLWSALHNTIPAEKNSKFYNETGTSREISHFRYWSSYMCLINYTKSIYMYTCMCIYSCIYTFYNSFIHQIKLCKELLLIIIYYGLLKVLHFRRFKRLCLYELRSHWQLSVLPICVTSISIACF